MLFHMELNNEKGIESIPSTYFVFMISDNKHLSLPHNNYKLLNTMPDITYYRNVEDKKKAYRIKMNSVYNSYMIMMASLLYKKSHNESIVIVSSKEENEEYGFNIAKQWAKIISDRYQYKCFKFTNTVLRSMRLESRFDETNYAKLLMDMDKIGR